MYNISNTNKITADERKKKKKPRIHLSKESLALKVFSELTDPLLGRYFSQFCPQTKLQEQLQQTPESRYHPQLAFGSIPFFKNRSLNWASFSVLLFRWSLDITESSARWSPTVTQLPPVQSISSAPGNLFSKQLRAPVIALVGCECVCE